MENMGGLAGAMPVMATTLMIVVLSSIGLPGLNGFVGELLLLLGAFQYSWWIGAVAGTTVILGAVYMLWMFQRIMFETRRDPEKRAVADLSGRERLVMVPIVLLVFVIGLFPFWFLNRMDESAKTLLSNLPARQEICAAVADDPCRLKTGGGAHDS